MKKSIYNSKRQKKILQLKTAKNVVKKANKIQDPLADFSAYRVFERNNEKIILECFNVDNVGEAIFQEIFQLLKKNMENLYNSCSWGWDEKKKYNEMTEHNAKYLIAKTLDNEIVGFSHFRFDMDYGKEVLYCYELQLSSKIRRKGLGKFFLQVLELIAFKNNMKKVVLTVLKHNTNALEFFHHLGYVMDETNPVENSFEDIPYQILSKINPKLVPNI